MELEKRASTGRAEGAGQDVDRWPRDEAAAALATTPHPLAAGLAEEIRTASIHDLLGWVEQAQLQAERPLQLDLAVAQTTVQRARTQRHEEQLVLQGLRRDLRQAGPWWWPGSWRRRGHLGRRITQREQLVERLGGRLDQAQDQVSKLGPASQAALQTWTAEQRQVLDRAVAAAQELQRRHHALDGPLLDHPWQREQPPTAAPALEAFTPRAGPSEASSTRSDPTQDRTDEAAQVTAPEPTRASVDPALGHRLACAGLNKDSSIAIVGGSLTGPVLSLLLRQTGFSNVHIYEATPSAVPQAGGVIGLDQTSLGVLRTIGVPQDEIVPFPSQRITSIKVADRRELGRVHTLYSDQNTTWTLAHGALSQRLPVDTLHTGARLVGLEPGADGRAVLHFQDGERATADLVVFADGRKSIGRKLLDPDRPLDYAGYVAHRGQLDDCPSDLRDFRRYQPDGTLFVLSPIRLPDGSIGADWTFFLNASAEQFRAHFGADPTTRTFVLPHQVSADARAHVDAMATELLPPDAAELVRRTTKRMAVPIVDIAPPTQMVYPVGSGHAVLLGDALAPVRPHTGRGANNGIDQAAGLATALASHRNDGVDLDLALSAWQDRNLPLATEWLERGQELGHQLGLGPELGHELALDL
jgi:2-polyprenyl-6-methoxyphenol hydroxylase-like FAD-dependent oxidoreductase